MPALHLTAILAVIAAACYALDRQLLLLAVAVEGVR